MIQDMTILHWNIRVYLRRYLLRDGTNEKDSFRNIFGTTSVIVSDYWAILKTVIS